MTTDFDYEKAKAFLRQKAEKQRQANHERFEAARRDFDRIVRMIIEKYHPMRIYQWGSLLNESHFSDISDIDIAVEGVWQPEEFFQMFGDADAITDFHLDLIEIDKIEPLHAESIRRKGRLVYERNT